MTDTDADAAANAVYAAWDDAFNRADPKDIASLYAGEALFLPATHDVIKGPAGIEAFFTALLKTGLRGHKFDLIEATVAGTLMFGAAKWSVIAKDEAGKDQPASGIASHVFVRQADGSYKLRLHTFN